MDILIGISLLIIGILTHYCGKLVEYLKLPSLIETDLSIKERIFCIIAYLPKATFQSAKAAIPIQMGVAIQAIAILSILVTAPIGDIGIKLTSDKLLHTDI